MQVLRFQASARTFLTTFVAACLLGPVSQARAQAHISEAPTLLYGVSTGAGHRTTNGTFLASALPAGALQPASDRTTGSLGFTVGVGFVDRVAVMAMWDQSFGGNTGANHWGTSNIHAVGRLWMTRRLWVEGGGGASELGYKLPSNTSATITRFWAPGGEFAAGADVLKGPRVALAIAGRYTTATFNGMALRTLSIQMELRGRR